MNFDVNGNLVKIYNIYVNSHPGCYLLSPDAIWQQMKEEGAITQEQYNAIKKGLIFDFQSQNQKMDDNWQTIFGFGTKIATQIPKPKNEIQKDSNSYVPNKKITNTQIKNNNYTSKNIYDVQYNGKKVYIYNKTTGKKSTLDFDKLLVKIKDSKARIKYMENFQKLPAEIIEFYANEGVTIKDSSSQHIVGGAYSSIYNEINLPYKAPVSTYIHEILHAVDFGKYFDYSESGNGKLKEAFELGLKRFEAAGFKRCDRCTNKEYYFSINPNECWSVVGEMLFNGKCKDQDILTKFWPEFIELEKQKIAEIQSAPINERY